MSVCGQSGQAEEDSTTEEVAPAAPSATRDIYKQKPASKVVRVLTVLAYLLSVSLAAILLSVYYVCVWRSPELSQEVSEASAHHDNHTHYQRYQDHQQLQHPEHAASSAHTSGGGDTTVNGSTVHSTPDNITGSYTEDSATESNVDAAPNATALPVTTPGLHNGSSEFNINETSSNA